MSATRSVYLSINATPPLRAAQRLSQIEALAARTRRVPDVVDESVRPEEPTPPTAQEPEVALATPPPVRAVIEASPPPVLEVAVASPPPIEAAAEEPPPLEPVDVEEVSPPPPEVVIAVEATVLEASPAAVEPPGVDAASPAVAVRPVLEPVLVELPEVAVEPCDGALLEAPEPVAVVELPLPVAEVRPPPLPPRRQEGVSGWLLSAIRRWTGLR